MTEVKREKSFVVFTDFRLTAKAFPMNVQLSNSGTTLALSIRMKQ